MSDKQKEVKNLLKSAKKCLSEGDVESTIEDCDAVIKDYDKNNFFAYLFKGKALQILKEDKKALICYKKASEIKPDMVHGWKGQLTIRVRDANFVDFFAAVLGLAKALQINDEPLTEIPIYINEYLQEFGLSHKPLNIYYLREIIPGLSELGDLIGYQMAKPSVSLSTLISMLSERESSEIKDATQKAKLNLSISASGKAKSDLLNTVSWKIYAKSEIPSLYEKLIDMEVKDDLRYLFQEKLLNYKYNMLCCAPIAEKAILREAIFELCSGMVLVLNPCITAWNLYLDWLDPVSVSDIDLQTITNYITLFGRNKQYGAVLYAYLVSEVSPYDKKKVADYLKPSKKKYKKNSKKNIHKSRRDADKDNKGEVTLKNDKNVEEVTKANEDKNEEQKIYDVGCKQEITNIESESFDSSIEDEKDEKAEIDEMFKVSSQDILNMMDVGMSKAKTSILCHRIVFAYCVHIKDYQLGLDYSQPYIKLILKSKSDIGTNFPNSELEYTLNLAIIYTYYESPKNFPKAIRLYASVLKSDPNNIKVKIGKSLILMETGKYEESKGLLEDVIANNPNDFDALQEYGWCNIQLRNYELGRRYLQSALSKLTEGMATNTLEIRSNLLYRQAKSYLMELQSAERDEKETTALVKTCFDLLIKCLKNSPNHALAFTALGTLYSEYIDDQNKAMKCFYKAFQLDPAEIYASYELVKDFSSKGDWEMVDVICQGVTENDRARKLFTALNSDVVDPSWPYRMLGCSAMERQDDGKAIEYFQSALRIVPGDVESWLGLGESYLSAGRIEASAKVFQHVLELQEKNWHATYMLAISQTAMVNFDESINLLKHLLVERPKELCVLSSLNEALVLRATKEVGVGSIIRSLYTLLDAFKYIKEEYNLDKNSLKLWKNLGEALKLCLLVQSHINKIPYDSIIDMFVEAKVIQEEIVNEVIEISGLQLISPKELTKQRKHIHLVHYLLIKSCISAITNLPEKSSKQLRSSLIYNLGVAFLSWYKELGNFKYRDCSILLLKKALQLESGNPTYWNALGIVSLTRNPHISQHCFIKASNLDSKSPSIWLNLGMLYMHYRDYELANRCFIHSQSLGPSAAGSWAGQALVSDALGDEDGAKSLFTHSYVLSNGRNPINTLLYSLSVIKQLITGSFEERNLDMGQKLTAANYGMLNYLKFYPYDEFALSLTINIIERIHGYERGTQLAEKLCELLENKLGEDDNENNDKMLMNYSRAKCQLARLQLGEEQYDKAFETSEEVNGLLNEIDELTDEVQKCILSCFTVSGLALYFKGDFDGSLGEFKKILEVFPESKRVVVLVSQVLYAYNETETKQAAIEELFGNIEQQGTSLLVAITIAAISIVEDLQDYLPAVEDELSSLPLDTLIQDTFKEIPLLLDEISKRMADNSGENEDATKFQVWQRNAILFPGENVIWDRLDRKVGLDVAIHSNNIDAGTLSDEYIRSGTLREIQRGIFLSPGELTGAVALRGCDVADVAGKV